MQNFIVRIQKAELNNFRNVEHGKFNFPCNLKKDIFEDGSDILGLYGQNGSGKTSFIYALALLEALLSGKRLPRDIVNYITVGKDSAQLIFEFSLKDDVSFYRVIYEFWLQKREPSTTDEEDQDQIPVIVSREKLSYSALVEGKWTKMQPIINYDYSSKEVFVPKVKFAELTNQDQNAIDELRVAKKYAIKQSTSFIFSRDTQKQISKSCSNKVYKDIFSSLYIFGRYNLCIIDNRSIGLINANVLLPFSFKFSKGNSLSMGSIPIKLNGPSVIPEDVFDIINEVINTMKAVLGQIIPGLSVELINLEKQLMPDGKTGMTVELVSNKNDKKVPLRYESDGIKKIISVLHMLIFMYNNPSMTVAIDELDSGVFEYLLGEILKIIDESGRGQLIFTSHNFRPLEILHKQSIIFTTTNSKNRYIRLTNVKSNNNLRDFYYHDLILGGQKECIYESTNSFAIARAFRIAGRHHES